MLCNLAYVLNKVNGNDGLSIEFYKTFWDLIGDPLVASFNESFAEGTMSPLQRQSVITLIEKKDQDRCDLENWRPISLLNVDAKIASKVIAERMKRLNVTRTEAMWIESLQNCENEPLGIKCKTCVKFLGIYVTYDVQMLVEKNFKQRLKIIKNTINLWKSRELSIYGKVNIIKTLLFLQYDLS